MSDELPTVSVVVPTRNAGRTLRACLLSLREQTVRPHEVIVVDNFSDDDTAAIAQELADTLIQAGPERSAQRNRGIAESTGEYVLWIDADMVLTPGVVAAAARAAWEESATAVFIPERSFGPGFWTACRALERRCYVGEPLIEAPRLVTREFFERSGGFDPAVAGQEDAELRGRLLASGAALARVDDYIEHDEGRLTIGSILRKRYYYGQSLPAYAEAAPGAIGTQGMATAKAMLRGRWILAAEPGHAAALVGLRLAEGAAYFAGAVRARRRAPNKRSGSACSDPAISDSEIEVPSGATTQGWCRSVQLARAFRVEQTDPSHFYGLVARDSVALVQQFAPLSGQLVVDVGGGPGFYADAFRQAGATYVSLDSNLSEMSAHQRPGPGSILGDALQLPFRTGVADIGFSSNLLEHVPEPWQMCDELVRITRPGGLVMIGFTNWLSPWGGHETSPWHYLGGSRAARRYERRRGKRPKNVFGESLYPVSVASALGWARHCRGAELVEARPRYYPRGAKVLLKAPGLREVATWNLLLVLRRT